MKSPLQPLQRLEEIGFKRCGQWALTEADDIKVTLDANAQSTNALYAFVSITSVLYVGKTTQQLRKRLYGYQNPRKTQTTNVRGHKAIHTALSEGSPVEVFVLPDHWFAQIWRVSPEPSSGARRQPDQRSPSSLEQAVWS